MYSSLAVDSDDTPHVSYYDDSNGALKYKAGSNGNFATTSFVDGGAGIDVGTHSSIAIDSNGKLHIIYVAITSSGDILKYASAEPEIGGGITGHLEWDEENTVMTGQASLSDLQQGEEYELCEN